MMATDADAAVTDPSLKASSISLLKGLLTRFGGGLPAALGAGGGLKIDGSGTSLSTTPAATESHLGSVGGHSSIITCQAVCDNNVAYGTGEVLFIPQLLANVVRVAEGTSVLDMIRVVDLDDQGGALDLLYFDAVPASGIGTLNAAFSIDDTDALKMLGWIRVLAADYEDWGGFRTATIRRSDTNFKADILKPVSGRDIYIAGISRDTKTYTTAGLRIYHHLYQD